MEHMMTITPQECGGMRGATVLTAEEAWHEVRVGLDCAEVEKCLARASAALKSGDGGLATAWAARAFLRLEAFHGLIGTGRLSIP
jgi:hypothetical protein